MKASASLSLTKRCKYVGFMDWIWARFVAALDPNFDIFQVCHTTFGMSSLLRSTPRALREEEMPQNSPRHRFARALQMKKVANTIVLGAIVYKHAGGQQPYTHRVGLLLPKKPPTVPRLQRYCDFAIPSYLENMSVISDEAIVAWKGCSQVSWLDM